MELGVVLSALDLIPARAGESHLYSKSLKALIPIRIVAAAIFASSDVVAGGVFQEDRAVPLLVRCQPKSGFLRKLRDLCLPIFFSYGPDALQFLLVNSAVTQIASLELQLTIM